MTKQSITEQIINIGTGTIWGTFIMAIIGAALFIVSRDFRFFLQGDQALGFDFYARTWVLAYNGIRQTWYWGTLLGAIGGIAFTFFLNKQLPRPTWKSLVKIWLRFAIGFAVVFSFLGLVSGALWLGIAVGFAWGIGISLLTVIFWSTVFIAVYAKISNRYLRFLVGAIIGFAAGMIASTMIRLDFTLTLVLLSGYLGAISSFIILIFFPNLLDSRQV